MDITRTEIILVSKLPRRNVPWAGKLMAVRNGGVLYVPVAFFRGESVPVLHKRILADAGLGRFKPSSPENMGGCFVKVFMGTVVLSSSSGDFGPIKEQEVILPHIETALRDFLLLKKIVIKEIDTDGLEV